MSMRILILLYSGEVNIEFYKKLDNIMIAGNFKVKIGKEQYSRNVTGKEAIHDNTRDGTRLCNLVPTINTYIESTRKITK